MSNIKSKTFVGIFLWLKCMALPSIINKPFYAIYNGEDLPPSEEATLTDEDCETISKLALDVGTSAEKICAHFKVDALNKIPRLKYGSIMASLNKKRFVKDEGVPADS